MEPNRVPLDVPVVGTGTWLALTDEVGVGVGVGVGEGRGAGDVPAVNDVSAPYGFSASACGT